MNLTTIILILSFMSPMNSQPIFDFQNAKDLSKWYVVNDGVMGGLSQGTITKTDAGNALFSGYVTTENNGGFSSVRYGFDERDVSQYKQVVLRIKGDGKSYQFRVKENSSQRYSYIKTFKTSGDWETIKLPFDDFYPGFRGYRLDKANFAGNVMEEIAFLIGNKRKESFSLQIEKITLE